MWLARDCGCRADSLALPAVFPASLRGGWPQAALERRRRARAALRTCAAGLCLSWCQSGALGPPAFRGTQIGDARQRAKRAGHRHSNNHIHGREGGAGDMLALANRAAQKFSMASNSTLSKSKSSPDASPATKDVSTTSLALAAGAAA